MNTCNTPIHGTIFWNSANTMFSELPTTKTKVWMEYVPFGPGDSFHFKTDDGIEFIVNPLSPEFVAFVKDKEQE